MLHNTHFFMRIRRKLATCMTLIILFTTVFAGSDKAFAEVQSEPEPTLENTLDVSSPENDETEDLSGGDVSQDTLPTSGGDVSGENEVRDTTGGDLTGGDVSGELSQISNGDLFPLTLKDGTIIYPAELFKNGEKVEDVIVTEKEADAEALSPEEAADTDSLIQLQSLKDGTNITILRGTQLYYNQYGLPNSSWSTHMYTAMSGSEVKTAYCIQPAEAAGGGSDLTGISRNDLVLLKKVLFYGYGGGEDCSSSIFGGDLNNRYIWTHILAAYCYRDDDNDYLHGLGIGSVEENATLTQAIQTMNNKKLAIAEVSKKSIEGNVTEINNKYYVVTDKVTLSGDIDLTEYPGLEMVQNGNVYGNTKVSLEDSSVYFRRLVQKDEMPTLEEITLTGKEVNAWVVKSSGKQDMAYMTFDTNSASLSITWNWKPTERGEDFALYKKGESLNSITKIDNSTGVIGATSTLLYKFNYANTGLGAVTFELYVKEDFTGLDGVTYHAGELFSRVTTDENGQAQFIEVQYSDAEEDNYITKYYLKEIKTAPGYLEDTVTTYDITLTWENGPKWEGEIFTDSSSEGEIYNTRKKAYARVWKKDGNTLGNKPDDAPEYLKDAEFTLYTGETIYNGSNKKLLDADVAVESVITDENGQATFSSDIPYGYSFYIKETAAPDGYALSDIEYKFTFETENDEETTYYPSETETEEGVFYDDLMLQQMTIKKVDKDSVVARGDASLNGAVYKLVAAENIFYPSTKVTESGGATIPGVQPVSGTVLWAKGTHIADLVIGDANKSKSYVDTAKHKLTFTAEDGSITVSNLIAGKYEFMETKAPEGYELDTDSKKYCDSPMESGFYPFTVTRNNQVIIVEGEFQEQVKEQYFKLKKYGSNSQNDDLETLQGAGFHLYLLSGMVKKQDGTYDYDNSYAVKIATKGSEKKVIVSQKEEDALAEGYTLKTYEMITDSKGEATSEKLPYGKYLLREYQVPTDYMRSGDTIITIDENTDGDDPYYYGEVEVINKPIAARIRIVKYDAETGNIVKLEGTAFQIYRMNSLDPEDYATRDADNNPVPYSETYIKDGKTVTVDTFYTDSEGYVITKNLLDKGFYKVVEKATKKDVWIGVPEGYSHDPEDYVFVTINSDSDTWEDTNGNNVVDVAYYNKPQKGKFTIDKQGGVLIGVDLKEDGTVKQFLYGNDSLAGATFEVYADGDIATYDQQDTTYYKDGDLITTIVTGSNGKATAENLPIGKYKVIESVAPTGYVTNSTDIISVEIKYVDPYTDPEAVITYPDKNAKAFINTKQMLDLRVFKKEYGSNEALEGVVFELYAASDIVAKDGTTLITSGSLITTAISNEDGIVDWGLDLPFAEYKIVEIGKQDYYSHRVDEKGKQLENYLVVSTAPTTPDKKSADHTSTVYNKPSEIIVSKVSITNSQELPGAKFAIKNADGKTIREWISSTEPKKIKGLTPNLLSDSSTFDAFSRDGLIIYTLVETRPADGYTTADEIDFILLEEDVYTWVAADEEAGTQAHWAKASNGTVTMVDDTTKISITKYDITNKKELPGAKLCVKDADGNVIDEWVSTNEEHLIEGKLIVGRTYSLIELKAPSGYLKSKPVKFTVADDRAVVQKVSMYDRREGDDEYEEGIILLEEATLDLGDQTGESSHVVLYISLFAFLGVGSVSTYILRRKKIRN